MDLTNEYENLFKYVKNRNNKEFIDNVNQLLSNMNNNFDINITDNNNTSFIMYAVITNNIELVEFLIKKNIKIDVEKNEMSIITLSIYYSFNEITKLLIDYDKQNVGIGLINYRDKNDRTPLHHAIKYNNEFAIDLLLESGANVNIVDVDNYNSLFYAIKNRSINICKKIIKKIFNINAKNANGENCLHIACNLQLYDIAKLLIQHKINIDVQDYLHEMTPLHYCVMLNDINLIKLLIENNSNINIQDIYGNTPLHYSVLENNYEIFEYLINIENINVNLWNINGEIPLHLIFKLKKEFTKNYVEILLKKSNVNYQDDNGNSCFYYILKSDIIEKYYDILKTKKINIFLKNKKNIYIFDIINENEKNKDLIYNLLAFSYLYLLKKQNKNWTDEIDILCSKKNSNEEECILKIKQKIKKIIEKYKLNIDEKKCYEKSFPMVKPSICVELSEGNKQQFCTFTGSLIDVLIGLIFLTKKYNNIVCSIISNEINKNDICNKYKLNNLITNTVKCELINFEIRWTNDMLYFGTNFNANFKKCIASKKKFIIIPLGIEMKEGSHANYLIYSSDKKELERFETYGGVNSLFGTYYNSNLLDEKLEMKFHDIDENIKYIKPQDFLPKISLQLLDITEKTKKKIGDPGFCALWSIWYADNRIKYSEIPREKLINIMIKEIKANNISFKNMIRNYSVNITEIRDEILSKSKLDINDWINDEYSEEQFMEILDNINENIKTIIKH